MTARRTARTMRTVRVESKIGELKNDAALIRELPRAKVTRRRRFAAIVRLVQRREASGPAKDMIARIRRDYQLCKMLAEYEDDSHSSAKCWPSTRTIPKS